jgi:hypothetical protein
MTRWAWSVPQRIAVAFDSCWCGPMPGVLAVKRMLKIVRTQWVMSLQHSFSDVPLRFLISW